ncbi:MAG: tyrosine-type recombinase/integrase [Bryobacterales bacterium]|nr:tyrosine-type recombinase/integrase [Bryobacterales bacterium]
MSNAVVISPPGGAVRSGEQFPALFLATPKAQKRFWEFFTANIRNVYTRKAYLKAVCRFSDWCRERTLELEHVQPIHVAGYIEQLGGELAAPSVKQHLAALRMLFNWLVVGQVIETNPATPVRGPKHSVKRGKTRVLTAEETRTLLDSIKTDTVIGLRDRALIALMVYTFARVGAVSKMKVEDYFIQGRRGYVQLHEKGGKFHRLICHHNLEKYLDEYIAGAKLEKTPTSPLFQSVTSRSGKKLSGQPMKQPDVYVMIRRRAEAAGIKTKIGCHTFRATGITTYLKNGGRLEVAQQMANHESARTTGLYDRRDDEVSLDEVEKIVI